MLCQTKLEWLLLLDAIKTNKLPIIPILAMAFETGIGKKSGFIRTLKIKTLDITEVLLQHYKTEK